jgi:hypothetical protein
MKVLIRRNTASGNGNRLLSSMLTYRPLYKFHITSCVRVQRIAKQTNVSCDNYKQFFKIKNNDIVITCNMYECETCNPK